MLLKNYKTVTETAVCFDTGDRASRTACLERLRSSKNCTLGAECGTYGI